MAAERPHDLKLGYAIPLVRDVDQFAGHHTDVVSLPHSGQNSRARLSTVAARDVRARTHRTKCFLTVQAVNSHSACTEGTCRVSMR